MRKVVELLGVLEVIFLVMTCLCAAIAIVADAPYWPRLAASAGLLILFAIWTDTSTKLNK